MLRDAGDKTTGARQGVTRDMTDNSKNQLGGTCLTSMQARDECPRTVKFRASVLPNVNVKSLAPASSRQPSRTLQAGAISTTSGAAAKPLEPGITVGERTPGASLDATHLGYVSPAAHRLGSDGQVASKRYDVIATPITCKVSQTPDPSPSVYQKLGFCRSSPSRRLTSGAKVFRRAASSRGHGDRDDPVRRSSPSSGGGGRARTRHRLLG